MQCSFVMHMYLLHYMQEWINTKGSVSIIFYIRQINQVFVITILGRYIV